MSDQKTNIITICLELFFQYGIKSITMDDIASKLGISKKTIYRHFKNKNDLVEKSLEWKHQNPEFSFHSKALAKLNAIDQYIEFYRFVTKQISEMNYSFHFDLRKYYPHLWNKFHIEHISRFQSELAGNIKQGIQEGLYRSEINIEFISKTMARFYLNMAEENHVIIDKTDILNLEYHKELASYHLHGVCTKKGIEYFKNTFK